MAYILSADREEDVREAFSQYREYLASVHSRFPSSAYSLVADDWYFDFRDHRCPHDAWLESVVIAESTSVDHPERRNTSIVVRLIGAYGDGHIQFHYPHVLWYTLSTTDVSAGHRDWRFDEFRLTEEGHLLHEIEWWGRHETGRWLICTTDVEFQWTLTQ